MLVMIGITIIIVITSNEITEISFVEFSKLREGEIGHRQDCIVLLKLCTSRNGHAKSCYEGNSMLNIESFFSSYKSARYSLIDETRFSEESSSDDRDCGERQRSSNVIRNLWEDCIVLHPTYRMWLNIALFAASTTMFILSLRTFNPPSRKDAPTSRNYLLKQISMPCELQKNPTSE